MNIKNTGVYRKRRGFTLVEIIISIIILAIIFMATFSLLATGFRYYWYNKNKLIVNKLTQSKIETLLYQVSVGSGLVADNNWHFSSPPYQDFAYRVDMVTMPIYTNQYDIRGGNLNIGYNLQNITVHIKGPVNSDFSNKVDTKRASLSCIIAPEEPVTINDNSEVRVFELFFKEKF